MTAHCLRGSWTAFQVQEPCARAYLSALVLAHPSHLIAGEPLTTPDLAQTLRMVIRGTLLTNSAEPQRSRGPHEP